MKTVIIYDAIEENAICYFSFVKSVTKIVADMYFKVTLRNGKYFIFDSSLYRYEIVSGKKVKIVNEL